MFKILRKKTYKVKVFWGNYYRLVFPILEIEGLIFFFFSLLHRTGFSVTMNHFFPFNAQKKGPGNI